MNIEFSTAFTLEIAPFMRTVPTSLFGDRKHQASLPTAQARAKFTEVWEEGLKQAVIDAPYTSAEEASKILSSTEIARYFEQDQKHKFVSYKEKSFVIQLLEVDTEKQLYEVEHLWFLGPFESRGPQDYDPRY